MTLILHGFRYSVYVRIARIALAEKGLTYEHVEVDPFGPDVPIEYRNYALDKPAAQNQLIG
jgi:glutathione S-transferase